MNQLYGTPEEIYKARNRTSRRDSPTVETIRELTLGKVDRALELLNDKFGAPSLMGSTDGKTTQEWVFFDDENNLVTVYDSKGTYISVGGKGFGEEVDKFLDELETLFKEGL